MDRILLVNSSAAPGVEAHEEGGPSASFPPVEQDWLLTLAEADHLEVRFFLYSPPLDVKFVAPAVSVEVPMVAV